MGRASMLLGLIGLVVSCAWVESVSARAVVLSQAEVFDVTGLGSRSDVVRGLRRLHQGGALGEDLLRAAKEGDVSDVQELLDGGADPNYLSSNGRLTPLNVAAAFDNGDVVGVLLHAGAQVELRNKDGITALEFAAVYGGAGAAKSLLAAGADPNGFDDNGLNPVHRASIESHIDVVLELVIAGGDISIRTRGTNPGTTALHIAARNGHLGLVRMLLSLGADVNAENVKAMAVPLDRAAVSSAGSVLLALIEAGADVDHKDAHGYTPLIVAAFWGNREAIEVLLENGANKSLVDNGGNTPSDLLCQCSYSPNELDACNMKACETPSRMLSLLNP